MFPNCCEQVDALIDRTAGGRSAIRQLNSTSTEALVFGLPVIRSTTERVGRYIARERFHAIPRQKHHVGLRAGTSKQISGQ